MLVTNRSNGHSCSLSTLREAGLSAGAGIALFASGGIGI
jgi:hypothetical protein